MLNKEGELKTYEDYIGRGRNLDITMVTKDLGRKKWKWKVMEVELSDHRMVEIVEEGLGEERRMGNEMRRGQWNWRNADWLYLRRMVEGGMRGVILEEMSVESGASKMQEILVNACEVWREW